MATCSGSAETANASRYLQQLCKHWGHRFVVEFDPSRGRIEFDADTVCQLDAGPERLSVRLDAADPARAESMKQVVENHLKRFAFREDFRIAWDGTASAATAG